MTCLDTLLDRREDRYRLTWGRHAENRYWVAAEFNDGTLHAEDGQTLNEAAESLLIALLDVEVAA